jgi:hypothetical protein
MVEILQLIWILWLGIYCLNLVEAVHQELMLAVQIVSIIVSNVILWNVVGKAGLIPCYSYEKNCFSRSNIQSLIGSWTFWHLDDKAKIRVTATAYMLLMLLPLRVSSVNHSLTSYSCSRWEIANPHCCYVSPTYL